MAVQVKLRKWGNSMAVIVPNKVIEERNLKEGDSMIIEIIKEADISHLFGSLKLKKKISGQEFKDIVRKGWEN